MARYVGLQLALSGMDKKIVNAVEANNVNELFAQLKEKADSDAAWWEKYVIIDGEMYRIESVPNKDAQLAYEKY